MFLLCFRFLAGKGDKGNNDVGKCLNVTFSVLFFSSELITKRYANVSVSGKGKAGPFKGAFSSAFLAPFCPPEMGKKGDKKFFIGKKVTSVFLKRSKKTYFIAFFFLSLRAVTGKRVI